MSDKVARPRGAARPSFVDDERDVAAAKAAAALSNKAAPPVENKAGT